MLAISQDSWPHCPALLRHHYSPPRRLSSSPALRANASSLDTASQSQSWRRQRRRQGSKQSIEAGLSWISSSCAADSLASSASSLLIDGGETRLLHQAHRHQPPHRRLVSLYPMLLGTSKEMEPKPLSPRTKRGRMPADRLATSSGPCSPHCHLNPRPNIATAFMPVRSCC